MNDRQNLNINQGSTMNKPISKISGDPGSYTAEAAEVKTLTPAELKQFSGLDGLSDAKAQMLSESLKTFSIILFRHYQQTFPLREGKVSDNGDVKKLSRFC